MRSAFELFVLLPAFACMGYAQRDTPLVIPTTDVVRIPFTHARQLLVWHESPFADREALPASRPDTMLRITAVYGRVIHQRGDTLVVSLTQVVRDGTIDRLPRGRLAVVDQRQAKPIERWGHNKRQTKALALTVGVVIVLVGAFLLLVVATYEEGT